MPCRLHGIFFHLLQMPNLQLPTRTKKCWCSGQLASRLYVALIEPATFLSSAVRAERDRDRISAKNSRSSRSQLGDKIRNTRLGERASDRERREGGEGKGGKEGGARKTPLSISPSNQFTHTVDRPAGQSVDRSLPAEAKELNFSNQ